MLINTALCQCLCISFIAPIVSCSSRIEDWTKYHSDDNKFSIEFPGIPSKSNAQVSSGLGPVTNYSIHFDEETNMTPEFLFYLDYADYPENNVHSDSVNVLEQMFNNVINSTTAGNGFKKIYEKDIQILNYPGREYVIDLNKDNVVIKCRIYIVKNRFYMLQVGTYASELYRDDINKFFNSFSINE